MAWVDPIKRTLVSSLAKKQAKGLQDAGAAKTPAMRQHEYEVARKSMLGEFSSYPPTAIQECIANAKAARRKERLELVNRHLIACPDHAKQAADLRQDMDEVESMRAVQIGNMLAKYSASIQLVGHSLGGGLASAAQGGSGLTASTYNAAGLHPDTVARYSTDIQHVAADPGNITAIRLQGEVLTKTQETGFTGILANKAVGTKRDLSPSHDENYFQALKDCNKISSSDNYPTYLHGMDEIIDSTEKKKSEDETTLKECAYRRSRLCG